MTATDADALLATILANPADDAPRLVYADWLDEQGDGERAEFVRVQCKLANGCENCDGTGRNVMSPCPCALRRSRERELFEAHKCQWFGESWAILYTGNEQEDADVQYPDMTKAIISRGFVHTIHASLATLLDTPGLRDLVRREPVEAVRVTDKTPWSDVPDGGADYGWWEETPHRITQDGPSDPGNIPPVIFARLWDANRSNRREDETCRWVWWDESGIAEDELERAVLAYLRADG